jgi:c-di-GMP-binding flagellar brake protein YcgR
MENRRQNYRHLFVPPQLCVELQAPAQGAICLGALLDLSIGGMKIRLDDLTQPLALHGRCLARSVLAAGHLRLALSAAIVHLQIGEDGRYLGLRFLPSVDPRVNEQREQVIWRFLMEEQRRGIKIRSEEA